MNRPHPPEHYQAVADLWMAEWPNLRPRPLLVIAAHYGVPRSTAARWVKEARRRGILTQPYQRAHRCPECGTRIACMRGDP